MEQSIFLQLSMVLAVAAGVSIVMRLLRQPLIVGYILTGMLVGPAVLNLIQNREAFHSFSEIGIALLLFIVGLGLNVGVIRATGKPVIAVFLANVAVMMLVGFGAAELFGLTLTEGLIAGLGLLFSSTIVIIKSLNDKREQNRLYGQIAIGVILVEDIVATLALLFVAAASKGGASSHELVQLLGWGMILTAGLVFAGGFVLPRVAKFFAHSQELLFTFALAWGFGVAALFDIAGFSLEVGALFAGVSLASLPYAQEISTRLKPLRDFFLVLFFISLGEQLELHNIQSAIVPALIFSAAAIAIKPLAVMTSMGMLGYTKQTGFKAGIHLSQISEFSVILAVLAYNKGIVSDQLISIMTLTALITIGVSTYLMKYDDSLYKRFADRLSIFERRKPKVVEKKAHAGYELLLFGYHKGGHEFVRAFREMDKPYLVVDYDPEVVETMEAQHIHHLYGDATDYELLEEIGVKKAKMVVSTIPDYETNNVLLGYLLKENKRVIFICHAEDYDDAAKLYEHGAAYVILPHFIGNEQISHFIRRNGHDKAAFDAYREKHLIQLGKVATFD